MDFFLLYCLSEPFQHMGLLFITISGGQFQTASISGQRCGTCCTELFQYYPDLYNQLSKSVIVIKMMSHKRIIMYLLFLISMEKKKKPVMALN